MTPIQDLDTGLWKWGAKGRYKYKSAEECRAKELEKLTNALMNVKQQIISGAVRI